MLTKITPYIFCLLILIASCKEEAPDTYISFGAVKTNEKGLAPLTATIPLTVQKEDLIAKVIIHSKEAFATPLTKTISLKKGKPYNIPLIGLYENYKNTVTIEIMAKDGGILHSKTVEIQTPAIALSFINQIKTRGALKENELIMTLIQQPSPEDERPFIEKVLFFDGQGTIRWCGNFKDRKHQIIEYIDGYLYAGSSEGMYSGKLVKYDLLGSEVQVYDISKGGAYQNINHDIKNRSSDAFIMIVDRKEHPSIGNFILEYNPNLLGNNVQVELDMEQMLPNVNDLFLHLSPSEKRAILHITGLYPYPDGESLLVATKNGGVAKINTGSGQLKWLLFPHVVKANRIGTPPANKNQLLPYLNKIYNTYQKDELTYRRPPANGSFPTKDYSDFQFDYKYFLLQPLDNQGKEIKDDAVVAFGQKGAGFEYPAQVHSPIVLKNGNVALFDNGISRHFGMEAPYSRVVEYQVKESPTGNGGTVQQVWEYAPNDAGVNSLGGSIQELSNGNRLVNFGAVNREENQTTSSKTIITEVSASSPVKELFGLTFELDAPFFVYRAAKVTIEL